MTIYVVLPEREKIDRQLMDMSLFNTKFKYILFKESTSNQRLGALHINEMNNIETQFELFENAKVMDRVTY